MASFSYTGSQSTSRAEAVMHPAAGPHWIAEELPCPVLFPHPQTHVSAAAMLLEPLGVALEGFLWGTQKHFITCVPVCLYVRAHVFTGMCRYLLECLLTCSEGEPQFVQNILPKNLELNLEYIWT